MTVDGNGNQWQSMTQIGGGGGDQANTCATLPSGDDRRESVMRDAISAKQGNKSQLIVPSGRQDAVSDP